MQAKQMVSNRDFVLRTTKGSQTFKAGELTLVSPFLVSAALAVGVLLAEDEDEIDFSEKEPENPHRYVDPAQRKHDITKAIETVEGRSGNPAYREDWTAARRPRVEVISELVGYKVQAREINKILNERNEKELAKSIAQKQGKQNGKAVVEPEGGDDYGA